MPVNNKKFLSAPSSGDSKQAKKCFAIVGIGASAGGLEALEQFFRHTQVDSGMAFVLVSHLDPSHASLLSDILQRTTTMPVVEAQDQITVEPNHVYIIPPNRDMDIFQGKLQLSMPISPRGQRMPIDAFLRSLAEDQQENAIGIILSGTGTDGTQGLRAIIGAGGITLVQEPTTAKYDGMPRSAIEAGYAIHILPVEKMVETLLTDSRQFTNFSHAQSAIQKDANGMNGILTQLRNVTGHDFSGYKKTTIGRRIERRMLQNSIEDMTVYARFLKENPAEAHILFKELLINVTCFFRDEEAFDMLKTKIFPELFANKPEDYVFRAWIAGCATGEEAYSIAILLREWMEESHQQFKVQLYSTDLDDDEICIARVGFYPFNIAHDVTPERLHCFFNKEEGGYRIRKEIREMVVFAVQNVIKDPPFTRLDLLSCRNLMIYLTGELQERLITAFHYALKPDGVLFLSPSESIGNHTALFSVISHKWKFYRAIDSMLSTRVMIRDTLSWTAQRSIPIEKPSTATKEMNFAELTRRSLVQIFAPASVVTNFDGDIMYVHGETGKYLRLSQGNVTVNVMEMAREGLELALRTAINNVITNNVPTLNKEVQIKTDESFTTVNLSVRILNQAENTQKQLLISFQDVSDSAIERKQFVTKRKSKSLPNMSQTSLNRIVELERDLSYLKESYQASLEEQQASNEELKSTNEEMQSTNEELQSTNEELETSKEELQSVNEEMITLNTELQFKIEELNSVQNDMKNLLDGISIGILFLDQHLIIRRFTREALRIYNLVNADIGRPLNDIKCMAEGVNLLHAAQMVLDSLIPQEYEMSIDNKVWILARIQPYRTLDNMIDGVVLTFTDITSRANVIATQEALILAEGIVDAICEPFIVLDDKFRVVTANAPFYQLFECLPEDTVGREIYTLKEGQWNIHSLRELLETVLKTGNVISNYALEQDFPVVGYRKFSLNARCIAGKIGVPKMIFLALEPLTS